MRWKTIITCTVVGGMLGFLGQAFVDWRFQFELGLGELGGCHGFAPMPRSFRESNKDKTLTVLWMFLHWLMHRQDAAFRTALIVALLTTSSVLATDQIRKNRESNKWTSVA